jgi:thymidine phosphorylase
VGLSGLRGKGAAVDGDTPFCMVHAADEASLARAAAIVKSAYVLGDAPAATPCIHARIGA